MEELFSVDQADALLSGSAGNDLGVNLLGVLGPAAQPAGVSATGVASVAATMAGAASGLHVPLWFALNKVLMTKIAAVAFASTTVTSGAAATGNLPAPVQEFVADTVQNVGINIPNPADDPPISGSSPASSTSTSVGTTSSSSTSTTTQTSTTTSTSTTRPNATTTSACIPVDITSATMTAHTISEAEGVTYSVTAYVSGNATTVRAQWSFSAATLSVSSAGVYSASGGGDGPHPDYPNATITADGCGYDSLTITITRT